MPFKTIVYTGFREKLSRLLVVALLTYIAPSESFAQFIDFETDAYGVPWPSDNVLLPSSDVYAPLGVTITSRGSYIYLSSHLNTGTSPIQGFRIQSGASAYWETFIDLTFDPGITQVAFDWHSSTAATSALVSYFDNDGVLLGTQSPTSDSTWIPEGSSSIFKAGSFSLDLGGLSIGRIRIEDQPSGTHIIGIDNLEFSAVPIPAAVWLFGSGLIGLIGVARRKTNA